MLLLISHYVYLPWNFEEMLLPKLLQESTQLMLFAKANKLWQLIFDLLEKMKCMEKRLLLMSWGIKLNEKIR